jgi:hypothetical protein
VSLPTPRHSTRGTEEYSFAELFLALGPQEIGDPRDNELEDLIGRVYALVVTTDGELQLYRREVDAATWTQVTAGLPPIFGETQPETRRRFSIAFDQSARAIIAYEEDATVYLTRWDPDASSYIQNVTIAGVDPVVAFDATWAYNVGTSDVLLFYLSTDRTRVLCRVQRDVYSVEYELHDYGTPVVLDRASRLPLQYQLLVSDEAGDPLRSAGEISVLLSEIYPYFDENGLLAGMTIADATHDELLYVYPLDEGELTASVAPLAAVTVGLLGEYLDEVPVELDASVVSKPSLAWQHIGILGRDDGSVDELDASLSSEPGNVWQHVYTLVRDPGSADELDASFSTPATAVHKEA